MPTKDELQAENDELRTANAQLVANVTGGCCERLCPCGVPYSRPCWAHIVDDMVRTCICPDHPDQAPEPRPNA